MTALARESPRIRVSWPGTKSRLTVREASGSSRCRVLVSMGRSSPVTAARC